MSNTDGEHGYRDVLQLPHARSLFAAALVGRLSFATVSLAMLLAVHDSTGSYATAGLAVGMFGLANVLVAPARARLVDRLGQRVSLPRLAAAYAALLCVLAGMTLLPDVPSWALIAVAGVVGVFPPPLGAAMRVLWASLIRDPVNLTRAYSLDAVAEELLFVSGPLLVGLTVALADAWVALVESAALALAGSLAMTRSRVTVAPRARSSGAAQRAETPLRQPGFRPLLVALVGVGVILGTVEITAPAFAQRHGSAVGAGVLLAGLSLGSAAGGLLYGRKAWRSPLAVRLLALGAALGLASAALTAAQHVLILALLLVLLGTFLAPALITGYLLADALTPVNTRTEASSWVNTASNAGAAGSAALAGVVTERAGTAAAFMVGARLAVLCVVLAGCRLRSMGAAHSASRSAPATRASAAG